MHLKAFQPGLRMAQNLNLMESEPGTTEVLESIHNSPLQCSIHQDILCETKKTFELRLEFTIYKMLAF